MPNATASKNCALATNPPCRTHCSCVALRVPTSTTSSSTQRVAGTAPTASPHARCRRTRIASRSQPPGHCPSIPARAGDDPALAATPLATASADAGSSPTTCSSTCAATARDVGCSKTIVGESGTPVSERRRDESSVAASESTPASISGVSTSIALSDPPVSSRTTHKTAAST